MSKIDLGLEVVRLPEKLGDCSLVFNKGLEEIGRFAQQWRRRGLRKEREEIWCRVWVRCNLCERARTIVGIS